MELDRSGQVPGFAVAVLELKAVRQLFTQGSLSTSTCNFIEYESFERVQIREVFMEKEKCKKFSKSLNWGNIGLI